MGIVKIRTSISRESTNVRICQCQFMQRTRFSDSQPIQILNSPKSKYSVTLCLIFSEDTNLVP